MNVLVLVLVGAFVICVFTAAYYQSYRDKQRWKRIESGRSLFGDRPEIPPLVLEGQSFDSHDRRVMVIWSNLKRSGFETVHDARRRLDRERGAGNSIADGARIFVWDGQSWQQKN